MRSFAAIVVNLSTPDPVNHTHGTELMPGPGRLKGISQLHVRLSLAVDVAAVSGR